MMFGLTLVTKSEKLLWRHQVEMLQDQVKALEEQVKHERARAEAAINTLLAANAKVVLQPTPTAVESDREVAAFDRLVERTYGLFEEDEAEVKKQAAIMDALQG